MSMGKRPSKFADSFTRDTGPAGVWLFGGDPMPEPEQPSLAERLKTFKALRAKLAELRRRADSSGAR